MSRTKRRPYTGVKAIDPACAKKNCPVCKGNKEHKHKKKMWEDENEKSYRIEL